jgi:hypothetical protein
LAAVPGWRFPLKMSYEASRRFCLEQFRVSAALSLVPNQLWQQQGRALHVWGCCAPMLLGFPIIRIGQSSLDHFIGDIQAIRHNQTQDTEILVAGNELNLNVLCLLEVLHQECLRLKRHYALMVTLAFHFWRINAHDPDGKTVSKKLRQARNGDCARIPIMTVNDLCWSNCRHGVGVGSQSQLRRRKK